MAGIVKSVKKGDTDCGCRSKSRLNKLDSFKGALVSASKESSVLLPFLRVMLTATGVPASVPSAAHDMLVSVSTKRAVFSSRTPAISMGPDTCGKYTWPSVAGV